MEEVKIIAKPRNIFSQATKLKNIYFIFDFFTDCVSGLWIPSWLCQDSCFSLSGKETSSIRVEEVKFIAKPRNIFSQAGYKTNFIFDFFTDCVSGLWIPSWLCQDSCFSLSGKETSSIRMEEVNI